MGGFFVGLGAVFAGAHFVGSQAFSSVFVVGNSLRLYSFSPSAR